MTKATGTTNTKDSNFVEFKGVLYYPHFKKPNTKGEFASGKYETDVSVSDAIKEQLESLGVLVKNKGNEKGNYVVVRSQYQPKTYGQDGAELLDIPNIGNGTEAKITAKLYPNRPSNAARGGKNCLGLQSVKIINLVEYESNVQQLED